MKLKRISPTNRYKEVDFGILSNNYKGKKILTPDGFTEVLGFTKIKTGKTISIKTKNGILKCDPKHRVLTNNGEKYVQDLSDDLIIGYNNELLSFSKLENEIESDLYDIEIDSPHWYYTSGIVSHNSIYLNNTGAANIKRKRNVLHVTLEMTWKQVAVRYMSNLTKIPMRERFDPKSQLSIMHVLDSVKATYGSELIIAEFPPDEISVDAIAAKIDNLRKVKGINIDVVIIDYLELLLSRNDHYNKEEYLRQKKVGTEIDRLSKKMNVAVYTATQTKRSSNVQNQSGDKKAGVQSTRVIDISEVAESYGKTMPMHYIVTINQTDQEYRNGRADQTNEDSPVVNADCRLWVVKNRNGRQFVQVACKIDYERMMVTEKMLSAEEKMRADLASQDDIKELPR